VACVESFRSAVEQLPVVVYTCAWDSEGTTLYVSPQIEQLVGIAPEAMLASPQVWIERVHPEDRPMVVREIRAAYEAERPFRAEYRVVALDGRQRWIRDQENIVRDGEGRPVRTEGVMVDVTAAKRTEQALDALRTVATVVASEAPAPDVFGLVAEHVARLLEADGGAVLRTVGEDRVQIVGAWGLGAELVPAGDVLELPPGSVVTAVRESGRPAVVGDGAGEVDPALTAWLGPRSLVLAPIRVSGRHWGQLVASSMRKGAFSPDSSERLVDFSDLVAMAVTNAQARGRLAERAATDPLTGLLNHRSFHERLHAEVSRALRHGRRLSLAMLDIDHFKQVNDSHGHQVGDQVLGAVAGQLADVLRDEDVLARIGGDEFAVLLPECARMDALSIIERARAAVGRSALPHGAQVTVSAGLSDLETAVDADALVRFADGALYWSKAHGRDVAWIYDPDVVQELSAEERTAQLERSHALLGVRALARSIDAKDPATIHHSDRVASLSGAMARLRGWAPDRIAMLHEAALVHDVGKIGVPDEVLFKSGPLTPEEYEEVRRHAALGAEIVSEVLAPEQVLWVRGHHERPDALGYPDGLGADEIADGAALLAVADAYDVMTAVRPYSPAKQPDEAIAECRRMAGRQFDSRAVEALAAVVADGVGVPAPA
jgi:diguanylate cyclase (GGDEF)-like protein/PAS domain S-box-containing protein